MRALSDYTALVVLAAESRSTLCHPMDYSPPGSSFRITPLGLVSVVPFQTSERIYRQGYADAHGEGRLGQHLVKEKKKRKRDQKKRRKKVGV